MVQRLSYSKAGAEGVERLRKLDSYVRSDRLQRDLLDPVKLRASQINGCAYCIDMHTKDARSQRESEQRLYGLNAWR